jgi:serine protease Do
MSRTREWLKFGGLVSITVIAAVVLLGAIGQSSQARDATAFERPAHELIPAQQPAPLPPAAQPLGDLSSAFTAVAELIKPAVVFIESDKYSTSDPHQNLRIPGMEFFFPRGAPQTPRLQRGTGSGFIISPDGYIMTNNHVVEGADKVTVRLLDKRKFDAKVVGRDSLTDVAVIKIDADHLPVATFGNSDSVRVGEWVLAVGNPLGQDFSFTVTAGIVSAKGRLLSGLRRGDLSIMDFIQTDAAINPGNSGGPLVNIRGQVVGMNAAIASENGYYQGYGFAIPANLARTVGNELIEDGRVRRSILGVSVNEATEEDAAYVGLDSVQGVVVQDFTGDNSPAEKAGIKVGDIIIALDGEPVSYVAQLQQMVGFRKPGSTVRVTVAGKGHPRRTVSVRLIENPDQEQQVASNQREQSEGTPQPAGTHSALGISIQQPPMEVSRRLGDDHTGPVVTDVEIDSPARDRLFPPASNGVDVITHVDGTRVRTVDEFQNAMKAVHPGDVVSLRVYNTSGGGLSRVVRIRLPR